MFKIVEVGTFYHTSTATGFPCFEFAGFIAFFEFLLIQSPNCCFLKVSFVRSKQKLVLISSAQILADILGFNKLQNKTLNFFFRSIWFNLDRFKLI